MGCWRGSSAVGLQKVGTRCGGSLWIRMVGCLNPEQSSFDPLANFSRAGNCAQAKGLSLLMGRAAKARLQFLRSHAQISSQKIISAWLLKDSATLRYFLEIARMDHTTNF